VLEIADDRETVSITPYKDAPIVAGSGRYDDELKTFELTYSFLEDGELRTVTAQITNVEFLEEE